VVINWHSNYAREYEVYLSSDNRNWTRVKAENYGNGGVDDITFTAREARYVRLLCENDRYDGYSVYELEVYAP
jgi:hypothetical protein